MLEEAGVEGALRRQAAAGETAERTTTGGGFLDGVATLKKADIDIGQFGTVPALLHHILPSLVAFQ